ncbi:MAG: hypothetical protein D6741_08535 [Planctomycetota bacterium]|nr:MAG: hypothetical protein D6741_08535 [Planctomycetota bacterium]
MSSRDEILNRIRTRLADDPPLERPPVPEVWAKTDPPLEQMMERFANELAAVQGELFRVADVNAARNQLETLCSEAGYGELVVSGHPLARELATGLSVPIRECSDNPVPRDLADVPVSLVEAEYLLADTGSALIDCPTPRDRLLCYLPPACVIVTRTERVREHMPAVWDDIAARTAEGDRRGEFVIVTGPSRTADIEKILILGVHGPKRVVILAIDG